jgi:hypothetical protein
MISRQHIINERSNIIPIKQSLSTSMKDLNYKSEYSIKQNFFDPSKSSPPNDFMIKLHMRMNMYNNVSQMHYVDMKDDSLVKE